MAVSTTNTSPLSREQQAAVELLARRRDAFMTVLSDTDPPAGIAVVPVYSLAGLRPPRLENAIARNVRMLIVDNGIAFLLVRHWFALREIFHPHLDRLMPTADPANGTCRVTVLVPPGKGSWALFDAPACTASNEAGWIIAPGKDGWVDELTFYGNKRSRT